MCTTFHKKDGIDIETVEQFEEEFDVDAEEYSEYDDLVMEACLCQIDVDRFLRDRPDVRGRFSSETGMDFWEQ